MTALAQDVGGPADPFVAGDTKLLNGTYHHECEVVRDGITMTVMQGSFTISPQVLAEPASP